SVKHCSRQRIMLAVFSLHQQHAAVLLQRLSDVPASLREPKSVCKPIFIVEDSQPDRLTQRLAECDCHAHARGIGQPLENAIAQHIQNFQKCDLLVFLHIVNLV
ncbi:MAG: hypothetical protein WCS09_22950, partial [Pseudomonadota bacterium]